ncbi:MAG: guanylate kinase [Acidobacteriota bacterium]
MSETGSSVRGDLWLLSAPSGTGKTTLLRTAFDRSPSLAEGLAFSVSHTTRAPRPGEVDGRDYYFVSEDEFAALVAADGFLEWADVYGQRKGTSRAEVERLLASGRDVLLEIDVQGVRQVRERRPGCASLFVLPPSFQTLEERLRARGSDDPEQIERRLAAAVVEIEAAASYEYVIVNDDLDRACEALTAVLLAGRFRRRRMARQIDGLRTTLPDPSRSDPSFRT